MSTVRKTITLTKQQDDWIKAQIARGDYTNDSEYVRALVRRDQEQSAQDQALRAAVRRGPESGVSEKTVAGGWDEAEQRAQLSSGTTG